MSSTELREKFLEFFRKKGHKIVPSSSLIPDDPSVLLTTAGMQQFKKYYTGELDFKKDYPKKIGATSVQKCFRTSDIDEVGDESHLTFFEMLGHFSFGDYFKNETIEWTNEFLTEVLKIPKERISATVFAGDEKIPFDKESYDAWSKFLSAEKIKKGPRADNVWGPAGPEGPCGAANEVYVDDLEVATLVFMGYYCAKDGNLALLPQKGVDVGWGFERLAMITQNKKNIFETDLFAQLMKLLPREMPEHTKRIIADHLRGGVFLIADGVRPSNKEAGYVLRRLLRRVFVYGYQAKLPNQILDGVLHDIIYEYGEFYPELKKNSKVISKEVFTENEKFRKVVASAYEEFKKRLNKFGTITTKDVFDLHQSFGLNKKQSVDTIKDILNIIGDSIKHGVVKPLVFNGDEYDELIKKHQEISRAGAEKKFGGHGLLLDTGELKAADEEELKKVTRLHTATHLLQAALRKILGENIKQAGSDITAERTRFDFSFERKLTDEEIKKVEDLVNFAVGKKYQVEMKEMALEDALKLGALHFFKEKYPQKVKVYLVGDFKADLPAGEAGPPEIFSRELCGGPHVKNTSEIGHFKILKQEAVGAGLRRLRATVTP